MYTHGRHESRFNDAPSQISLRRHARQQSQANPPPVPALPLSQAISMKSNLPRPSQSASTAQNLTKTSTSSKVSSRSAVKSSRRGSLQNKTGLSLEAWQQYAERGPAPLPSRKDNPYGVYMAQTGDVKPFRAPGYGTGIPVSVGTTAMTRSDDPSATSRSRPPAHQHTGSRISRFEDAMDAEYQSEQPSHPAPSNMSFRISRFEDAYDGPEAGQPPVFQSRIPRSSSDGERNREKGVLAEVLFDHHGISQIKEETYPERQGPPRKASFSRSGSQPFASVPLKNHSTDDGRAVETVDRTDRRASVSSDSKLLSRGRADYGAASDQVSIKTTNTFGGHARAWSERDDASRYGTITTASLNKEGPGTIRSNLDPSGVDNTPRSDTKARKSLAGVFSKGPGSVKSFGTAKTSMTAADLNMDKEQATTRRAKGSWSSSQTFGDRWQSPRDGKVMKTPEPLPPKVEIVGTIRDAFPVVRESIELDAARGLMPAFQLETKSQLQSRMEGSLSHNGLRTAVKEHSLPPSAYKRGMTPEPFLEYRARKKSSASPLLAKMKSAWHLNGHQASQSADLEKIEEMLGNETGKQTPMSGLAKMRSNLNLSRFKSHKASLADIQANARSQVGDSTHDSSFTYVEGSVGDRSTISDWTLASVSSVSDGLPAPWEEGGSQGGGRRIVKRKKSAAAGMLLGKVFGGKSAKDKKDKRDSKDRFSLKNAASQLTLRPKRPQTPSGRASITSSPDSILSQDRKSSFANTRRLTFGQSTDPAIVAQDATTSREGRRSTSPDDTISPQLPEFSFVQSTSPGLGLHPETLGTDGYISRFGYGVAPEAQRSGSIASSTEETPPASAVFEYSLHSHPSKEEVDVVSDHNAALDAEYASHDSSLDVVEDDLDYLRARMSYLEVTRGNKRQSGGPLPKRTSVQGVFGETVSDTQVATASVLTDEPRDTLRVPAQHQALPPKQNLPQLSASEPAADWAKMSTVTDDLQLLVANFASYTPSSMMTATPTRGNAMISPSESQYLETESPTPLSRNSSQMLAARKSTNLQKPRASPVKISPLRLALHNNHSKRYAPESNLDSSNESSTYASHEETNSLQTIVTEATPRANNIVVSLTQKYSALPKLQTQVSGVVSKGSHASSLESLTPLDGDAPRDSFDFTGEYKQLNENGCRQSFLAELDRLGLMTEDGNLEVEQPFRQVQRAPQPSIGKRSSLNRDFRFGRPAPVPEAQAVPSGGLVFKARSSQHLPDDSVFSIASMSSLGKVVDTGISGDFVNVFEREFAAKMDRPSRSTPLHSVHKSWTDSLRSSVTRPRDSVDSIDSALVARDLSSHTRKNSSFDSTHSTLRRLGRPGVDSDRMFQTNCLYSIEGSPTTSPEKVNRREGGYHGAGTRTVPSYDTILDYKNSVHFGDSICDQTLESATANEIGTDSIFSSGNPNASFSLFGSRPLSTLSVDTDSVSQAPSPLARKSKEYLRGRPNAELTTNSQQRAGGPDAGSSVFEAVGDDSFLSDGSGTRPVQSRMLQNGPSHLHLSETTLIGRISDKPGRHSTDSQNIVSRMLDPSPDSGSSIRQACQKPSRNQDQLHIRQHDSFGRTAGDKRGTMDSIMSKYEHQERPDSTQRWVDWRREAELEIERSKMSWTDTAASRAAVETAEEFKPPTNLEEVARLIQISRYVNTSLAEASPGKQIARRAEVPLDSFDEIPASLGNKPSDHKPIALPTKFQRNDTTESVATLSGTVTPATPSGLFSFAMTNVVRESPLKEPLHETTNHGKDEAHPRAIRKSLSKKPTRASGQGRPRVSSTVSARRAKLGWTRRREVATSANMPKVTGSRTPSKSSSGNDTEAAGSIVRQPSEKRRSIHRNRNPQHRKSIRA